MSRAPLVRSLTHQQQMLAEQAMLVIDNAIHAFWRRHASLRRYRPVIDSRSTAMVAVTLASFNFNPLRSKATTYYTVAIHNALRKVALREKRRVEVPAHSKAQYGVDKKAIQPSWGSATECMETLDPQTRQLVHESVVVGRQITEIARGDAGLGCQLHLRLVAGFASTTESLSQRRQAGSPRRRLSPCCPAATNIRFDLRLLQIDLLSAVDRKASGAELRSLSRNRGEHRFQAIGRSVQKAPRADAGKIDTLQPLYSQHVTGVIEIFAPSPTELLHNQILRPGQPYRPAKARENDTTTAVELMLNERIIKEGEEFNEKGGISTGGSNMSTPPGQRVELHLGIENNHWCKLRHNALDRFASHGINNDINIARRSRHAIHTRGESTG